MLVVSVAIQFITHIKIKFNWNFSRTHKNVQWVGIGVNLIIFESINLSRTLNGFVIYSHFASPIGYHYCVIVFFSVIVHFILLSKEKKYLICICYLMKHVQGLWNEELYVIEALRTHNKMIWYVCEFSANVNVIWSAVCNFNLDITRPRRDRIGCMAF